MDYLKDIDQLRPKPCNYAHSDNYHVECGMGYKCIKDIVYGSDLCGDIECPGICVEDDSDYSS